MADIELVIKIPEEEYKRLAYIDILKLRGYIENGIPLPKGHGDLKDADALKKTISLWVCEDYLPEDFIDEIDNEDTIIEADKGESEEI